jgi:hypothetical protein
MTCLPTGREQHWQCWPLPRCPAGLVILCTHVLCSVVLRRVLCRAVPPQLALRVRREGSDYIVEACVPDANAPSTSPIKPGTGAPDRWGAAAAAGRHRPQCAAAVCFSEDLDWRRVNDQQIAVSAHSSTQQHTREAGACFFGASVCPVPEGHINHVRPFNKLCCLLCLVCCS